MAERFELIVEFRPGVDEPAARAVVGAHGGTVRRRMRADSPEQVLLLCRFPSPGVPSGLEADPRVRRTEVNGGGFRPMG